MSCSIIGKRYTRVMVRGSLVGFYNKKKKLELETEGPRKAIEIDDGPPPPPTAAEAAAVAATAAVAA